jgi:hypothetical protein
MARISRIRCWLILFAVFVSSACAGRTPKDVAIAGDGVVGSAAGDGAFDVYSQGADCRVGSVDCGGRACQPYANPVVIDGVQYGLCP